MSKPKSVKLRAFVSSSTDMNKDAGELLNEVSKKLEETNNSEVRMMPLSSSNFDKEYDLCCTFEKSIIDNEDNLFGTMLRIKDAGDVGDISKELLSQKKFGVNDIINAKNNGMTYADVNRFYYLIKGKYLVCNLQGNYNIKGYEAYINWLLNTKVYQFNPKITVPDDVKLTDLKDMTFGGTPVTNPKKQAPQKRETKLIDLAKSLLFDFMKEDVNLKDIDLENVLTAKLILSFKKPRDMTNEEYQKQYGAVLRHIRDSDDVVFHDKNKRTIKGSEIESSRLVSINTLQNGVLNEAELKNEMIRFITEIENADIN